MPINNYGNDLIKPDIKRLKRLRSLKKDLDTYFVAHVNQLNSFGRLSCQIAAGKNYVVCKERIAISSPKISPSKGCRLWFVVTSSGYYIRCLVYAAVEEKIYKKSLSFQIVRDKLSAILE